MNGSHKKDRNQVERKTKTQLAQELSETQRKVKMQQTELSACNEELQKVRAEVEELRERSKLAEAEVQHAQNVIEENKKLQKKLEEIEEDSSSQIQESIRNLREAKHQSEYLEKEIGTLKEKLAEYEKQSQTADEAEREPLKASKATFLIHLYPRQGHYQGRIEHSSTRDKKIFSDVDEAAISKFIAEHLPPLAEQAKTSLPAAEEADTSIGLEENRRPHVRTIDVRAVLKGESPKETEWIKEIRFQQLKRFLEPGRPFQAHRPFSLFTRLHFPVLPTANNLNIDTSSYEICVVATDVTKTNVIARSGVAEPLCLGVTEYENQINVTGLAPGKYLLRIYAFAPYAKLEGTKDIEVILE